MSVTSSKNPSGNLPTIPGYVIEQEIGRGSSGVVFRARQISVDRLVALKVMHAGLGNNTRSIRRLQREARIAAHLAHPSLIAAIDMGESGGHWWFAMELVDGPSLAERLEKGGRLMEDDALGLFMQLCDALQHASEKGVVHRDIKPANILLERPDFPRLVDLGLARLEDDPMLTRSGATLGTPHYISPEQARDPALADVRSDIWSLGATLYHAVCGRPPFSGKSTAEILSAVLYGPIPDPSELRPELSAGLVLVLRKCLSRDPDLRYFAPAELREDLQRVRAHKSPQIKRAALEPLDPTGDGNASARIGLGLALGVGALAVLFAWSPWSSPSAEQTANEAPVAAGPWSPLAELEARVAADEGTLAAAFADLAELRPRVPSAERDRLEDLNSNLRRRLQRELQQLWSAERRKFAELLEARNYAELEERLDRGLRNSVLERTGFTPQTLPRELDRSSFARRTELERGRLKDARDAAQLAARTAVERYVRRSLIPAVERHRRLGAWSEARRGLNVGLGELYDAASADLRGVDTNALGATLAPLTGDLAQRLLRLEEDWAKLDGETLLDAVGDLAINARRALDGGERGTALERYEQGFDDLLKANRLDRSVLAAGPTHHSLDAFVLQRSALEDRADEIAQRVGNERLAALDAQVLELYERRDYVAAVAFWEAHQSDPELLVVEGGAAVRLEGAQELVAFLRRAALGIQRRGGSQISISQGSIKVSGKVLLAGDPWERGFRLLMSESSSRDYLLRPDESLDGDVLGTSAVEMFAIDGADLTSDIGLQLQRALFRYHEGDFEGAHKILQSEALRGGDLLLYDLGLRVAHEVGREEEVLDRRQEYADKEVDRLTGSEAQAMDPKQRALQIGRLLREYRDVLVGDSEGLLLRTRARLLRVLPPSTIEDFQRTFGPSAVSFPQFGRVRLEFEFSSAEIGSWSRGDWYFTGDQAWSGLPSGSLVELEQRPSPTIELLDPLHVQDNSVEVRVRFFQPEDSPPELFAISVLGFHALFTGKTLTEEARILTGTRSLVDIARRVRAGQGRDFEGFEIETEYEVRVRVSRGSGKITVWIDGEQVDSRSHLPPGDGEDRARLTLRAIEPVQVREVVIEADRR